MQERKYVLDRQAVLQKMERMSLEVAEQLGDDSAELIIIGVRNSGKLVADMLSDLLKPHLKVKIKVISVILNKITPKDIFLSEPNIDFNDKNIIIADDVVNSGKTLLYAVRPLLYFQPKRIQTLVLVERMHKLFPIKSDYVGMTLATTFEDHILVDVRDNQIFGAYIA